MEWILLAGAVLVLVAALSWFNRPAARLQRREDRAERTFIALVHLPPKLARESLERAVAEKARRFPGKSRAWYAEQAVADLRRDRR